MYHGMAGFSDSNPVTRLTYNATLPDTLSSFGNDTVKVQY